MANLTVPQLIKILLGIFVVVVVVLGVFLFFRGTVLDFFKNLIGGDEEASEDLEQIEVVEDENEVIRVLSFEYPEGQPWAKTYIVVSSTYVIREDSDGTKHYRSGTDNCATGWYWDYDNDGEFGQAESNQISKGIPICMVTAFVTAMNNAEFSEVESSSSVEEEDTEGSSESCNEGICASRPAEDLVCSAYGNVRGYTYRCTRNGCTRTGSRKRTDECDFGCVDGECVCLPAGSIVKLIGIPHRSWCCNGNFREQSCCLSKCNNRLRLPIHTKKKFDMEIFYAYNFNSY